MLFLHKLSFTAYSSSRQAPVHLVHQTPASGQYTYTDTKVSELCIWNPLWDLESLWFVFSNTVRGQNMALAFDPGPRWCFAATAQIVDPCGAGTNSPVSDLKVWAVCDCSACVWGLVIRRDINCWLVPLSQRKTHWTTRVGEWRSSLQETMVFFVQHCFHISDVGARVSDLIVDYQREWKPVSDWKVVNQQRHAQKHEHHTNKVLDTSPRPLTAYFLYTTHN